MSTQHEANQPPAERVIEDPAGVTFSLRTVAGYTPFELPGLMSGRTCVLMLPSLGVGVTATFKAEAAATFSRALPEFGAEELRAGIKLKSLAALEPEASNTAVARVETLFKAGKVELASATLEAMREQCTAVREMQPSLSSILGTDKLTKH